MAKFILTVHIELLDPRSNDEVLAMATQIEELLSAADVGRFVGSGGGMNQIDLTYLVEEEELAKKKMEEALVALGIKESPTFVAEEFSGDEASYFDEVEGVSLAKLSYFFGLILFLILSFLYVMWSIISEIRS